MCCHGSVQSIANISQSTGLLITNSVRIDVVFAVELKSIKNNSLTVI